MKKYIEPVCGNVFIVADSLMQDASMGVLVGSGNQFDNPDAIEAPARNGFAL